MVSEFAAVGYVEWVGTSCETCCTELSAVAIGCVRPNKKRSSGVGSSCAGPMS
jgi:hypothetical protein